MFTRTWDQGPERSATRYGAFSSAQHFSAPAISHISLRISLETGIVTGRDAQTTEGDANG